MLSQWTSNRRQLEMHCCQYVKKGRGTDINLSAILKSCPAYSEMGIIASGSTSKSSAKVKKMWIYTSTPSYAFIRDNFVLLLIKYIHYKSRQVASQKQSLPGQDYGTRKGMMINTEQGRNDD
jgi:hypothetical protein